MLLKHSQLMPFNYYLRLCCHIRKMSTSAKEEGMIDYSKTLLLPKTPFKIKSSLESEKSYYNDEYQNKSIYLPQKNDPSRKMKFVLLDGPPFANGLPHIGHALNKILKDIIVRYKILEGYSVEMKPGWDVHGLPIEIQALQQREKHHLSKTCIERTHEKEEDKDKRALEIRHSAKLFAEKYMTLQKSHFLSWGLLGDWSSPFITMDASYEANQIRVFYKLVEKGLVYQANKPVHWSPSSKTALAEAELEYYDKESLTVYYAYPLTRFDLEGWHPQDQDKVSLLIWTTTPWTIPSNKAVAVNKHATYGFIVYKDHYYIVVKEQCQTILTLLKETDKDARIHEQSFLGSHLLNLTYFDDYFCPEGIQKQILHGPFVEAGSGTGIVHMAPDHGMEDFILCQQEKIPNLLSCLVDDHGNFTAAAPNGLAGLSVFSKGSSEVIRMLQLKGACLMQKMIRHSYPHDWRTKKPILIRATQQWFIALNQNIKDKIYSLMQHLDISAIGRGKLEDMVLTRAEWCLSRQRAWGVPIPVFYTKDGQPLIHAETVTKIIELFEQHGSDIWWQWSPDALLPEKYQGLGLQKGRDTMDVWFDSGVAWHLFPPSSDDVTKERLSIPTPAAIDLIIEGVDQFRGWFQSLVLTCALSEERLPVKKLLYHGFVLDQDGKKMSKSLGNVISPEMLFYGQSGSLWKPYGFDTARLWTTTMDYNSDIRVSPDILERANEIKEKLRNTARFMIANLEDFTASSVIPYASLPQLEQYMLASLFQLDKDVKVAYKDYNFNAVLQYLTLFSNLECSAFYFDIIKDALYADPVHGHQRRSIQTVLAQILKSFSIMLAPIIPFTADEIYQHLPLFLKSTISHPIKSIFAESWKPLSLDWHNPELLIQWQTIKGMRGIINKLAQQARDEKVISRSAELDANIILLRGTKTIQRFLTQNEKQLASLFLLSKVDLYHHQEEMRAMRRESKGNVYEAMFRHDPEETEMRIELFKTDGFKCPRCWIYLSDRHDALCRRCHNVVV